MVNDKDFLRRVSEADQPYRLSSLGLVIDNGRHGALCRALLHN